MKCELCGKQYIALGVHLRHKHGVDPDDYREEFGILRTTPLVDEDLSEHLSQSAKRRLQDEEYKLQLQARCRENVKAQEGKPNKTSMSQAGRLALATRNSEANARYLEKKAPEVAAVLREKKTMLDVKKVLGVTPTAGKKMAAIAGVEYTAQSAKEERDRRAATTVKAKVSERVAKVMDHFETTESASEMCRRAGIGITTYKRWVKAGLIKPHHNSRLPHMAISSQS